MIILGKLVILILVNSILSEIDTVSLILSDTKDTENSSISLSLSFLK
jgi:hypothetical protein